MRLHEGLESTILTLIYKNYLNENPRPPVSTL
jgi:hypothetical protein